jgi:hypothetical protein
MDVYKVAEFLRARSAEDMASPDGERRARGRVVAMVTGISANVLESVEPELLWLAGHYSGHPDWAEL